MIEDTLSYRVLSACIDVHRRVGPGLVESTYQKCLAAAFRRRQVPFQREVSIHVEFDGIIDRDAYRADFIVGRQLVVELKAVGRLTDQDLAQVRTYMKWTGCRAGLLVNFNRVVLMRGVRRVQSRP